MRDSSDLICSAVLIILGIIGWIGYSGDLDTRLEKRMRRDEAVWQKAVNKARAERCFREGYAELYAIDGELVTEKAEKKFRECL